MNLICFRTQHLSFPAALQTYQSIGGYEVWKKMGSPENPTAEQISILEKAGQLALLTSPTYLKTDNGNLKLNLKLPRQGVSLLKFDW